jgi:hypothetical protein
MEVLMNIRLADDDPDGAKLTALIENGPGQLQAPHIATITRADGTEFELGEVVAIEPGKINK